ncbi:MAG TPA: hypothetical protein VHV83_00190 [Armatimonadota bacterium]|nr:hypothetical protein [Armatimonadota bacterium]
MNNTSKWLSVILSLFLCTIVYETAQGTMVDDFEKPSTWFIYKGNERGGAFSLVPAPEKTGQAGKCSWTENHAKYLELHLDQPKPLSDFDTECNGTVIAHVYSDGSKALRSLSLRLLDAKGEVFQLAKLVSLEKKGWHEITYQVTPDPTKYGSWGNVNKQIDLPVRLLGFSFDFNDQPGGGSFYIDDIECIGPGHKVMTRAPLWSFDKHDSWRKNAPDSTAKLAQTNEGVVLTVAPSDKAIGFPLLERYMGIRPLGTPKQLTLKAELLAGTGVSFNVRVRDARGEIFPLRSKTLNPGMNTLTWMIPDDKGTSWGDNRDNVVDFPVNLHELFFSRTAGTDEVKVRLISASVDRIMPAMDAITVNVDTGNPIHVLKVGEEKNLSLHVCNTALEPVSFKLTGVLENFAGDTIPFSRELTMEAQSDKSIQLDTLPKKLGIWWVKYTLIDTKTGSRSDGNRSFCYMKPAGPTPGKANGFLFSICSHTDSWGEADAENEILASALCGAKVIRAGVGWGGLQSADGSWNWTRMDSLIDRYGKQGIEIQYLFGYCPDWAVANKDALAKGWEYYKGQCPRLDVWRAYVSAVAKRYDGRIRFYEIWNEPDIGFWTGTLDEYLQMAQATYEEVKRVDPKLNVMTGGFCGYRNPDFVSGVVQRGQQWFDTLAYHAHGAFPGFQREVDGPLAGMRKLLKTPKALYFNETAVTSVGGAEKMQAETLVKKLTFAWSRGAMGYTWYDLRNDGFNPSDAEHNYGMVTNDFYPKAVYPAYNTLALHLSDKQFSQELNLGSNRYGFVFANKAEQIIASWSENAGEAEQYLILKTNAKKAFSMDIMGNQQEVPVVNGRVVLSVSTTPAYLVLQGATVSPQMDGALVAITGSTVGVAGRPLDIKAEFRNPFSTTCTVECSWSAAADVTVSSDNKAISLAPGKTGNSSARITIPQGYQAKFGETKPLMLSYRMTGTPWESTIKIPITLAVFVPQGNATHEPQFTLNDRKNVFNYYENDPNKAYLTWKGPDDLSAKVWLGHTKDAMTLHLEARDDKFVNQYKGGDIWRGDGIQLAFQVPGQNGYWELGLARLADGTPAAYTWTTPKGIADPTAQVQLKTELRDGGITYDAVFPYQAFGLSDDILANGIKFNLILNDNDGEAREGWVQISRGIGDVKDPSYYPFVVFEK